MKITLSVYRYHSSRLRFKDNILIVLKAVVRNWGITMLICECVVSRQRDKTHKVKCNETPLRSLTLCNPKIVPL